MALELATSVVRSVEFAGETRLEAGALRIDREALAQELRQHVPELASLRVELARPGEATRVVAVKDVLEPRVKRSSAPPAEGRVEALGGLAVVTCGRIVGFQEGIIDLFGPGAAHTPFSQLELLVLECEPEADLSPHAHEAAVRRAGLLAAEWLAAAVGPLEPDRVERFELAGATDTHGLPRVAYLCMLLSQGLLHDSYVFGRNAKQGLPQAIDPRAVFEGAIASGNCVSACDKNTTWHHQNNAVVRELFRRDGSELAFAGMVLSNAPTRLAEKRASAESAIRLVKQLEVQGVVISKEGFGNPDADLMLLISGLETAGIATVAITDEFAGTDGGSQSLADTVSQADALVSVGNANARILLPPAERTLGPADEVTRLAGGHARSLRSDGSIEVELQALVGSTNQIGHGRLSCDEV